jgi:hypothetical protein
MRDALEDSSTNHIFEPNCLSLGERKLPKELFAVIIIVSLLLGSFVAIFHFVLIARSGGDNFSTSGAETAFPTIDVLSPQNAAYNVTPVSLTFVVNESTIWIGYSLDGESNVTIQGSTTLTGLTVGQHSIVVFSNETPMSDQDIENLAVSCALSLSPPLSSADANELSFLLMSKSTTLADLSNWLLNHSPPLSQSEISTCLGVFQSIAQARAGHMAFSDPVSFKIEQPRTIIVPEDYQTIQGAINAASLGDTVYVNEGTYYENPVVNKTLSLVGENAANTPSTEPI